jgi:hypothetical protein
MNKIQIIPLTHEVELVGIAPTPASKHLPDWYKRISPYKSPDTKLRYPMEWATHNTTVKRCVPFLDAMTAGYMFVLDDDVFVEQTKDGPLMRWKTEVEMITWHDYGQYAGLSIPKGYHNMVAKWHNDYQIVTPLGYSMMFTHPINRFDLPFKTITGIVDTDKHPVSVQFPFFLEEGFEGIIKSGTPVSQMIPIKKDSWKIEQKKFNKEETYKKFRKFKRTFANSYKTNFWQRKEYL